MRTFLSILLLLVCILPISAQHKNKTTLPCQAHILSVGAQGGITYLSSHSEYDMKSQVGGLGALAVGYTFYAPVQQVQLGFHTGLELGYHSARLRGSFSQLYTNTDYLNNTLDYTTSAAFVSKQQYLQCDVPLMMALRYKGLVWNVGLYLQPVLWQKTRQTLSDPSIDAYYSNYAVYVTNELITGIVPEEQMSTIYHKGLPSFGLGIGTEIGYEIALPTGALAIQTFLNYSVCNNYHTSNAAVIQVSPILDASSPVPDVTVNNAGSAVVSSLHPLTFGIRLAYIYEWRKR